MNKLERWLSIGSNLGVLVGIVFLALEISASTNATKAQIYQTRAFENSSRDVEFANSDYIPAIYAKLNGEPDSAIVAFDNLDAIERERLLFTIHAIVRSTENNLYQCEIGLLDEEICAGARNNVLAEYDWWAKVMGGNVDPFYTRVNRIRNVPK